MFWFRKKVRNLWTYILLFSPFMFCTAVAASGINDHHSELTAYGDFRFRLEQDWDSYKSDGKKRDDRLRARIRLRLGLKYFLSDSSYLNIRLRTGAKHSQQSPHLTVVDFDGNDTGDRNFSLDKWYLKVAHSSSWVWFGRNSLSVWKDNELFLDDDVTPVGINIGKTLAKNEIRTVSVNAGHFLLPAGMRDFCGKMTYGQAVYKTLVKKYELTIVTGLFNFDKGNLGDIGCNLYQKFNGARDYSVWAINFQAKSTNLDKPISIGIDTVHNREKYGLDDLGISVANINQTNGWDFYVKYGDIEQNGNWLIGYWFADIEELAVNNSFSNDDWVRWGNATQTRASNMLGHEFRFAYKFDEGKNIVVRLYLAEAISGTEDGNRFRIDLNIAF